MIKFEKTETMGWEGAIRGMRNPMNSWDKSDSYYTCEHSGFPCPECIDHAGCKRTASYHIGPNDLDLARRLAKGGPVHAKYRRQIFVSVDITAPLYWWKEFDTYKVGTTANSCSTMHKIHAEPFKLEQFSHEHLVSVDDNDGFTLPNAIGDEEEWDDKIVLSLTIIALNHYRNLYLQTKDKRYWYKLIQLLPSSYNQKRTVTMTYENLYNAYHSRKDHKLDEWRVGFCEWAKSLPYSELFTMRREDTSFQEDLEFFVNDCTNAQLEALYERVKEKLGEKA